MTGAQTNVLDPGSLHRAEAEPSNARFDVERVRQEFPILTEMPYGKPLVYLASAATSQKPQAVIDAISGAQTYATTHLGEDDEVLITAMEHHSNIVPWQMVCEQRGGRHPRLERCHKMYGPTGIGVLWGRGEVLAEMPPYQGGGDMIASVSFDKTVYNTIPYKFEAGTPNLAGAVGLGAAIDFLDGVHPHDIGTILDREGVAIRTGHHCAQPLLARLGLAATARASLACYSTRQEIDALVAGLGIVQEVFR